MIESIKEILAQHRPRTGHNLPGLTPAAVLAPFYPDPETGLSLVFTKRTDHLDHHSGQISFPGGRHDARDHDYLATALRETNEEIGVRPEDVTVWGRLNQEATITGFSVAPFVGVIPYPYSFKLNDFEVERLIIVPLDHLLDPEFFSEEMHPWKGANYKTYRFTYKNDVIWGATARMVFNLLTLLRTGHEPPQEDLRPFLLKSQ
ncbi:MAG: CoA pyrophosphatase [Thermodesulfobacteriota bacterium]